MFDCAVPGGGVHAVDEEARRAQRPGGVVHGDDLHIADQRQGLADAVLAAVTARAEHQAPHPGADRQLGDGLAQVHAGVERRRAELENAGQRVDAARLRAEIIARDRVDRTRPISPLRPAPDATIIDSSNLEIGHVVQRIVEVAAAAGSNA